MHPDTLPTRDGDEGLLRPVLMALGLHAALVMILLLAGWWQPAPQVVSVAGPVVEASLVVSPAAISAAEKAMED
ncbi:MAG: protein TolA, partial [Lysobacteraceae bacterium]